jgi:hypothetical protein
VCLIDQLAAPRQQRASSAPAARQRSHIISKIFWMPVTAQPLLGSLMGECKGQVPGLEKTAPLTCLHLTSASQALALLTHTSRSLHCPLPVFAKLIGAFAKTAAWRPHMLN